MDALAYSPAGFIWDNALGPRQNVAGLRRVRWRRRCTGQTRTQKGSARLSAILSRLRKGESKRSHLRSYPPSNPCAPYHAHQYVGWDMDVPDQYRADSIHPELQANSRSKGEFPNLVIICLPNDHTSGTTAGCTTPAASHVADNDLAFGQIVEAISHSRFWKETCIFAIEDDPQAGWDHVSGYRTTA